MILSITAQRVERQESLNPGPRPESAPLSLCVLPHFRAGGIRASYSVDSLPRKNPNDFSDNDLVESGSVNAERA